MQKIGKAFGDMPGLSEMFAGAPGGAAARVGAGAAEDGDEGEEVDSAFLAAAMEGDLAAVKKFISDAAAGVLLSPLGAGGFAASARMHWLQLIAVFILCLLL